MKQLPANIAGLLAMTSATQGAVSVQTSAGPTELLHAVSTVIGSIGSLIWIVYLYRCRFGKNDQTPPSPPAPPAPPVVGLLLALTLAGLLAVSGCKASPERRLVIARQTYTAALTAAADLRAAGKVTDAQYRTIEQARVTAAGAIRLLEINAAASTKPDASTLQQLENAVGVIVQTVKDVYYDRGT